MATVPPPKLQKVLDTFSAELRAKLLELFQRCPFDEHHFDAFQVNHGDLNLETFAIFLEEVEREAKEAEAKKAAKAAAPPTGSSAAKRARMGFMPQARNLPSAVGALLGRSSAPRSQLGPAVMTPDQKRREDVDEAATPEPVRKPVQVSLKSSMNDSLHIVRPSAPLTGEQEAVQVEVLGDRKLWSGPRKGTYAWMDESLDDRTAERDRRLVEMEAELAAAMQGRHPDETTVLGVVGRTSQAETILCGRIVCDGLEGRLNERAILLEGSRALAKGARVQLNCSACPQVAAFPGQLVAVLGRSGMTGTTFHARDFIAGLPLSPAPPLPAAEASTGPLHILVLSGPYCLKNSLDYSPLEKALEYAAGASPDVLLLLGPLVDAGNKLVMNGDVELPDEGEPCTFEELYTQYVLPILHRGLQRLRRVRNTQVLVVPSLEEALSFHPMPQPPLDVALSPIVSAARLDQIRKLGNVKFLPNPAHVQIGSTLRVSVTSADALSPVLRSGLVLRPEEKKIEKALRLLQQQRTLFPVVPREPAAISETRASALDFPGGLVPDICIFPSASGTPAGSLVDGRIFVNPGSVCRPAAMGTLAQVWVSDSSKGACLGDSVRVDIQSLG